MLWKVILGEFGVIMVLNVDEVAMPKNGVYIVRIQQWRKGTWLLQDRCHFLIIKPMIVRS